MQRSVVDLPDPVKPALRAPTSPTSTLKRPLAPREAFTVPTAGASPRVPVRRSAATFEPSLCERGGNTTGAPPTSGGRHVPTRPLRRTGAPLESIGDGQHGSAPEVRDSVLSDRPLPGRLRARRTGKLSSTVRHGCRARGARETSYGPREDRRSEALESESEPCSTRRPL